MVPAIEDRRLAGRAVALRISAPIAKPNKFVAPPGVGLPTPNPTKEIENGR